MEVFHTYVPPCGVVAVETWGGVELPRGVLRGTPWEGAAHPSLVGPLSRGEAAPSLAFSSVQETEAESLERLAAGSNHIVRSFLL